MHVLAVWGASESCQPRRISLAQQGSPGTDIFWKRRGCQRSSQLPKHVTERLCYCDRTSQSAQHVLSNQGKKCKKNWFSNQEKDGDTHTHINARIHKHTRANTHTHTQRHTHREAQRNTHTHTHHTQRDKHAKTEAQMQARRLFATWFNSRVFPPCSPILHPVLLIAFVFQRPMCL